ncbi:hypothetical protein SPAR71_2354 [Streptococcus pneumoniae GA41437]|nr:hypothetical protein SPAR71_2354 [Streptococcus pneumoniae GA41437]
MVSNLKENKTLDFHFVDEEEGKKGLEDGDYYMVVTLPSDLSEKQLHYPIFNRQQLINH